MQQLTKHLVLSFTSKITAILAQIVSIGVITKGFDSCDLTLWLLFFQLIFFFSLFDFGLLGNSYLNSVAIKQYEGSYNISFTIKKLFQGVILYSLGFFLFFLFFDHSLITGETKYDPSYLKKVFFLFSFFSFLKLPFSLWSSTLLGSKKGEIKSLLEIFENLTMMGLALSLFFFKASFTFAILTCSSYSLILSFVFFLFTIKKEKSQPFILFDGLISDLKISFPFWLQNLLSVALFSSLPLLVASWSSLEKSEPFVLSFRLCSLLIGIHFAFLNPLLPFFTQDSASGDLRPALSRLKKALFFSSIYFLLGFSLIFLFFEPFALIWTKRALPFTKSLFLWTFLYGMINVLATFLNALGRIKKQVIFLFVGSVCFVIGIKIFKHPFEITIPFFASVALLPLLASNLIEILSIFYESERKKTLID